MNRDRLVFLFRYWGNVEAQANLSPLYAVLAHAVADDPELLDLAAEAIEGQPPPNVFFAAVHALLAGDRCDPLAEYYLTLGGTRPADAEAGPLLRQFCLTHRDALLPIIRTRLTQTNEVRRSAVLLPAFASVAADRGLPLSVIEIGPSAGLNLLFDRYQYHYGSLSIGDPASPVILDSEPRGALPDVSMPKVASRVGIDINPLDVTKEDDVAWLRALLWPEHTDRLALMNAAIKLARHDPPRLLKGDVFEHLPALVEAAPDESAVCVFATFVLNQFSPEARDRLRSMVFDVSRSREIHLLVMGFSEFVVPGAPRAGDTAVWIARLKEGAGEYRLSSVANPHGRWIDWRPDTPWEPWAAPANPEPAARLP